MELEPAIGIIGGSGLYDLDGFSDREELEVETPFGMPSDKIVSGMFAGRRGFFLPRHGKGHRILPTELNHRANIYALRSLGGRVVIAGTAVGSLKEHYHPRDIILPDQYFDRTSRREHHTFFGKGMVAHVTFADPVSEGLRRLLLEESEKSGATVHDGGTYVCMDGPAFSTRAESNANRQLGFDVIGMTNLPEAKLAREAEMALATLAMVTDYDCWKVEEEPVTIEVVISHLMANALRAKEILARVIPRIPTVADWPEHRALENAIITDKSLWPKETVESLRAIVGRFLTTAERSETAS
ncbi:S-methyl-5'-thioadenosine phosphorylase [Phragmitibacter flavus]|uniref:S-methyl-5'-thioadenosine phosphorylase n=2 Tax=Phragmitibacter flavus TaxID=2576071 RepID=A0A5R8K7A6_9BACT|nr:S-methyl-5'-thioadenosine phosphorylase [Phragmitibacter flavus]